MSKRTRSVASWKVFVSATESPWGLSAHITIAKELNRNPVEITTTKEFYAAVRAAGYFHVLGKGAGERAVVENILRQADSVSSGMVGGAKGSQLGYWTASKDPAKQEKHKACLDELITAEDKEADHLKALLKCYWNAKELGKELDRILGTIRLLS